MLAFFFYFHQGQKDVGPKDRLIHSRTKRTAVCPGCPFSIIFLFPRRYSNDVCSCSSFFFF